MIRSNNYISSILFILSLSFSVISCSADPVSHSVEDPSEPIITPATTASISETAIQVHLNPPYTTWVDPVMPTPLQQEISARSNLFTQSDKDSAQIILSTKGDIRIGSWYYLAVVPFYSPLDNIHSDDLLNIWQNRTSTGEKLYLSPETNRHFASVWGESDNLSAAILDQDQLLPRLWQIPESIAIIPFEELEPHWKVLSIDGNDPLSPDFSPDAYPLSTSVMISITENVDTSIFQSGFITNFDRSKFTSMALTGVTALVRDTAAIMEDEGILYPSLDIGPLLSEVDITHISNEVPFAVDCPTPDSNQESLYFCSKDEYIQLLEAIGTDVVELSGDHFGDWGPEAMLHSLDIYHQRKWLTYGGGKNLQDGLEPVFTEHNGNRFAFIGCNGKAHDQYATASETNPGASRCDFDWMEEEISHLVESGYLVIATMQHEEVDSFYPIAIQQYDFRRLADAGATIVSGSQAHHPQAVEFYKSTFIHYGLGNLFFDQWYLAKYNPSEHINKDKSFIDIHYFYDGSYINSRLVPLQFIDNARPRKMTPDEKIDFLEDVFESSIWNVLSE